MQQSATRGVSQGPHSDSASLRAIDAVLYHRGMRTSTTEVPLRDLVKGFNEGRFPLPQFQREYVWKPRQILNLLDSLARGYPIGSLYLWRPPHGTKIDPKQSASGSPTAPAAFDGYLIDGQQRLTSLVAAFGLSTAQTKHESLVECYLDLLGDWSANRRDTRVFVSPAKSAAIARRVDTTDVSLLHVSTFLEPVDPDLRQQTRQDLEDKGVERKQIDDALRSFDAAARMLDHRVPVTTIHDVSDGDVIPVFSRLNKGGTTLRAGDVTAAELAQGKSAEVLRRIREFVVTERPKRLGFGFSFAFRALVVFHRESAQFTRLRSDWVDQSGPHGRSLVASWSATEKALSSALAFVDQRMGWCRRALVPSNNALIVLAYALDQLSGPLDEKAAANLTRWLCLTALRGVFQGSVESSIDRFVKAVKKSSAASPTALVGELTRDEGREIDAGEDIRSSYAPMWGPGTQVMMAWLVSRQARDWVGDDLLVTLARGGPSSLPGGNLTVHHIVPRKRLAQQNYRPEEANDLANYALVSGTSNSELGDRLPLDAYHLLDTEQRKRAAVQFFGVEAGDRMTPESYEEFLDWRAARIAKAWNAWLGFEP
jgi:hypothetical protein